MQEKVEAIEYQGIVIVFEDENKLDFSQMLCYLISSTDIRIYPDKNGNLVLIIPAIDIFDFELEPIADAIILDIEDIKTLFLKCITSKDDLFFLNFICKKVGRKPKANIIEKMKSLGVWDINMETLA